MSEINIITGRGKQDVYVSVDDSIFSVKNSYHKYYILTGE